MVRIGGVVAGLASVAVLAACAGSDAGPTGTPVPIASVTELGPNDKGGLLSVLVDDFRGCPTAFTIKATETADEISLTAVAYRDDDHQCGEIPKVFLERPVGSRRIVDGSRGLAAATIQGEQLVDPCEGRDPCFGLTGGDPSEGRTFLFALAPPAGAR